MAQRSRVGCPTIPVKAVQNGAPLSYAVVGEKEFSAWKEISEHSEEAAAAAVANHRQELLKASQDRVANWPNTIEALRRRKELTRQERLDEEEARRRVIDAHGEDIAKAKRKSQIDKANLMLYETDDRVKSFTSKMILASVLEERSGQIEAHHVRKQNEHNHEMKWAVLQEETLRRANQDEEIKQQKLRSRAMDFRSAQLAQLESIKQTKLKALRDDKEEGQRIKEAAEESERKEAEEERVRRAKLEKVKDELLTANERQKLLKANLKRKEALEAEQVFKYAQQKEEQLMERKRRVDERFTKKLLSRQEIIDRQAAHLRTLQEIATERELKQMRDLEKEREEREGIEKIKKEAYWKEIAKSREAQLERKEKDKERKKRELEKLRGVWQKRVEDFVEEELEDQMEKRKKAISTQHFQLLQQQEHKLQKARAKEQKQMEILMAQKAAEDDDLMFKGYVNAVMTEYVKAGRAGKEDNGEISKPKAEADVMSNVMRVVPRELKKQKEDNQKQKSMQRPNSF